MNSFRRKTTVASLKVLATVMMVSATPAKAFIKFDWDCHESQSDADCMRAGGLKGIFIYDEIIPNDARQMTAIDTNYPTDRRLPKILITSRGGSMKAATEIGRILRRRNASIEGRDIFFPDQPARCDSACVSLAAGAVDRQFDEVGVHRPFVTGHDKACKPTREELADEDLDEELAYFTENLRAALIRH